MAGNDQTPPDGDDFADGPMNRVDPGFDATGCARAALWLASPVALYFLILWVLGLWPHDGVWWIFYLLGALAALFMMFVVAIAGRTLGDDIVKLAVTTLVVWGISRFFGPAGDAVLWGLAAGAALPLVYRALPSSRLNTKD